MNAVVVRPQTKLAAALLAAGVVSAASIVGLPENPWASEATGIDHSLPTVHVDVANASVITDWLWNFSSAVNGVANGVTDPVIAGLELPFDATAAIAAVAQNPSLSPNVLSWLVQRYVNPSDTSGQYSYPADFERYTIERLARLLPYPLGLNVINAVNQITDAIGGVFSALPSPGSGATATNEFWSSDIGRAVYTGSLAVTAPVLALSDAATYLGALPATLEGTVESAIQDPTKIPGLVSGLVYGLVSPFGGLLGRESFDLSRPFANIPGPIGELVTNVVTAISNGIAGVLQMLPKPIYDRGPAVIQATVPSTATPAAANSVPPASLAVTGGITLKTADPVEKKVDATDSTTQSTQDPAVSNTPATAPKDSAPSAGDVKPVGTSAAGTDAPKTGTDTDAPKSGTGTSVSNPVTSGNKVTPGDKFDNGTKGGTAKENGSGAGTSVASGAGGAGAAGVSGAAASVASGPGGAGAAGPSGAEATHAAA